MKSRFYFSKQKGSYRIIDRQLDLHIATCNFREAAVQIASALNEQNFKATLKVVNLSVSKQELP